MRKHTICSYKDYLSLSSECYGQSWMLRTVSVGPRMLRTQSRLSRMLRTQSGAF